MINETQKAQLIEAIYDLLMSNPDMGLGDMGDCREAAEYTVENWIKDSGIKNLIP